MKRKLIKVLFLALLPLGACERAETKDDRHAPGESSTSSEASSPAQEPPRTPSQATSESPAGTFDATTALVPTVPLALATPVVPLNDSARTSARNLLREVRYTTRQLSSLEVDRTLKAITSARDVAAGRAPTSDVLCLPSIQKPGKYCMKSINGDPSCIGNYFDNGEMCRQALTESRDGRACYQSESKPGKALVSLIAPVSALIGNYYPDFDSCQASMKRAYGPLVCMASAKLAGKWFIANLDNNAMQVGGYVNSLDECLASFD